MKPECVYVPHSWIRSALGGLKGCLHLSATVSNTSKIFAAQSIIRLENTCSVLLARWFAVPSLCLLKVFRGRVALSLRLGSLPPSFFSISSFVRTMRPAASRGCDEGLMSFCEQNPLRVPEARPPQKHRAPLSPLRNQKIPPVQILIVHKSFSE